MAATIADGNVRITCDNCGKPAPPAAEIMAAHGLIRMGWECHGGTHVCPDCKESRNG